MFSLMLFMFFFFLGIVAMLFYILRRMEANFHALSEEHAQLRVVLRALESRFNAAMPDGGEPWQNEQGESGQDPLLHLSFDKPNRDSLPGDDRLELR